MIYSFKNTIRLSQLFPFLCHHRQFNKHPGKQTLIFNLYISISKAIHPKHREFCNKRAFSNEKTKYATYSKLFIKSKIINKSTQQGLEKW